MIEYVCDNGGTLSGSQTAVCQQGGTFNPPPPTCSGRKLFFLSNTIKLHRLFHSIISEIFDGFT